MVLFTCLLVGCSKQPKAKSDESTNQVAATPTSAKFETNLPDELTEAVHLIAMAKEGGGSQDKLAYAKTAGYVALNPTNPKGLYLRALCALNLVSLRSAFDDLDSATHFGLPATQNTLAKNMMDGMAELSKGHSFDTNVATIFKAQGAMLDDVREMSARLPKDEDKINENNDILGLNLQEVLGNLIDPGTGRTSLTALAILEYFPYAHSSEVETAAATIFTKAEDLSKTSEGALSATSMMSSGIRLLVNFIGQQQEAGRTIEAMNGAKALHKLLINKEKPLDMVVVKQTLAGALVYYLGDKEGSKAFMTVGGAIFKDRASGIGKEVWQMLDRSEQEILKVS